MVVWHHLLNGHEFEQTIQVIVKDREASLATVHGVNKESYTTEQLNNETQTSSHSWSLDRACRENFPGSGIEYQ